MTRLRGLVALVALATLTAGVPLALARFGSWPIHGFPTSAQLRDLGDAVVSDTAVFAVLTVAAWAVWAVFMASVAVEVAAVIRRIQAPRLVFAGPLQRSARGLVAAVILALTIGHTPRPAAATPSMQAPPRADLVVDLSDTALSPPAPAHPAPRVHRAAPPVAPAETAGIVTVRRGDSAWSIAEAHLGDGMRWRELWDANRGLPQADGRAWTDPQIIRPGWHLRLPAAAASREPSALDTSHTVVPGDTLTEIAQSHLGETGRYREVFDLNRDVEQPDGGRLTDPDLIRPGWTLQLPTAEVPAPEPSPSPPPAPDPTVDAGTEPPITATTATTATTTTTAATPAAPAALDSAHAGSNGSGPGSNLSPALAGIAGALVLATGLAARIGFLRRRRATRGAHTVARLPDATGQVLDSVVAAGDVALVRWAGQHLAQLVARLDRRRLSGAPIAVELSETAGIELLWDSPQPDAPGPWTAADGGWAWRLPYDPDAPVPADELPAPIPALVTIGQRDGRQLLIDLEAYGAITVSGDPGRVDAFLRSVAVELATGQDLADADVHTLGLDTGIDHVERLHATPGIDDAIGCLDRARQTVAAALDADHLDGTFAARVGSPTPIEATVVVAHAATSDATARLLEAAPRRHGVAVVVAVNDAACDAPARIELRPDGSAHLAPLGIDFEPVALPSTAAVRIDELLDMLEHAEPGDEPDPGLPGPTAASDPSHNGHREHSGNGEHPVAPVTVDTPAAPDADELSLFATGEADPEDADVEPAMLVRVLGAPAVPDRPDLGRRELILAVLLACRGAPVAASAAQDALWGGKPVEPKTVWNVIGATRRALGDLPDGTPVMPAANRDRGTLRLAAGVVTDLALLQNLVERANASPSSEAISLLRQGLELVTGPPFDAAGYDWAYRDQDVAHASTLIEHSAETLADLALDSGLIDVARDAVVRGLRGLPGNEQLYRCRMRIEHHAGNLAGVSAAYDELVTYLADLDTEPSPATTALYQELVRPVRR